MRAQDRLTFVYVERCVVHRDSNAITATDQSGTIHIPAATLGALLMGPGTKVTHAAMMTLAASGSTAVWVGERGVRYYAHGRSLAESSRVIEAQAQLVSNRSSRLAVARQMYQMRFPGEDVSELTMQQLRGREGARVRRCYREHSERTGVSWSTREYNSEDFGSGTPINQALSVAHSCLYGVVHAVVVALGASPSLGFVHTGHARAFVHDVADLYKAEVTIPIAFDVVAGGPVDIAGEVRRAVRDAMADGKLLQRCVADVRRLLLGDAPSEAARGDEPVEPNVVYLWDEYGREVVGGSNHGDPSDEEDEFEVDF
nr:type I-E CRISPR-associated endonuclease Cas1e [Glycomyces arizonensis]